MTGVSGARRKERYSSRIRCAAGINTATLTANGSTYLRGEIVVVSSDGVARTEAPMALCRCGTSGNKPYGDGTHTKFSFAA